MGRRGSCGLSVGSCGGDEVLCGEMCLGGFLGRVTGAGVVGHFLGVPNLQESR